MRLPTARRIACMIILIGRDGALRRPWVRVSRLVAVRSTDAAARRPYHQALTHNEARPLDRGAWRLALASNRQLVPPEIRSRAPAQSSVDRARKFRVNFPPKVSRENMRLQIQ